MPSLTVEALREAVDCMDMRTRRRLCKAQIELCVFREDEYRAYVNAAKNGWGRDDGEDGVLGIFRRVKRRGNWTESPAALHGLSQMIIGP